MDPASARSFLSVRAFASAVRSCPVMGRIDQGAAVSIVDRHTGAYAVVEQLAVPTVTVMTMPGDVR